MPAKMAKLPYLRFDKHSAREVWLPLHTVKHLPCRKVMRFYETVSYSPKFFIQCLKRRYLVLSVPESGRLKNANPPPPYYVALCNQSRQ